MTLYTLTIPVYRIRSCIIQLSIQLVHIYEAIVIHGVYVSTIGYNITQMGCKLLQATYASRHMKQLTVM